jgi:signal transduction histidine kinase
VVTFSDITVARNAEENLKAVVRDLKRSEEELQHRGEELLTVNESMELTILELHQTQAQLVQSEKMASLGQLTAGIAHEINNPINFVYSGVDNLRLSLDDIFQILTAYESLETETEPDRKLAALENIARLKQDLFYEENKEMIGQTLHAIRYGASRTAEIVKGLRNFSRLDEADLKVADVHEGLNSALILLTHQFKDRVDVIREYDPEVPAIECYAGQLNQVFMNLLSNAVQAIDNKGWIRIFTRNEPDSVIIEISDSGKGIPADVQSRVFEPFFTTKEVGQGTGLGLSISYGIIGKHRGQISFRSAPGEGTTFTIVLPKSLQPAKAPVLH